MLVHDLVSRWGNWATDRDCGKGRQGHRDRRGSNEARIIAVASWLSYSPSTPPQLLASRPPPWVKAAQTLIKNKRGKQCKVCLPPLNTQAALLRAVHTHTKQQHSPALRLIAFPPVACLAVVLPFRPSLIVRAMSRCAWEGIVPKGTEVSRA